MSQEQSQSQTATTGHTPTPEESSENATTQSHSSQLSPESGIAAYRCPVCEKTYQHELLARIHITRASDDSHAHRNGLMPEAEIEAIDADGKVIKTITRSPDELEPETLTVEAFPDGLSEKRRHALLIAAHNPYESSAQAITDRIEKRADETGLAVPGYTTVCRSLKSFYQPPEDDESGAQPDDESITDLTAKQQAIIIARLADPDATEARIADMVGCADSYPGQVYDRAEHVIDNIEAECETDDDLPRVLASELSASDIRTLHERGLLAGIPVSLPTAEMDQDEAAEADAQTGESADQDGQWGSPVSNQTGLRADPANPFGNEADTESSAASDATQQTLPADQPADDGEHAPDNDDSERVTHKPVTNDATLEAGADPQIPADKVNRLRQQVAFLIDAFERVAEPEASTSRILAFAEQFHHECATMLEQEGEA